MGKKNNNVVRLSRLIAWLFYMAAMLILVTILFYGIPAAMSESSYRWQHFLALSVVLLISVGSTLITFLLFRHPNGPAKRGLTLLFLFSTIWAWENFIKNFQRGPVPTDTWSLVDFTAALLMAYAVFYVLRNVLGGKI